MRERFVPGQVLSVRKSGSDLEDQMKVQIVPGDGRVIVSPVWSRKRVIITTEEAILGGEIVDGGKKLGTVKFLNPFNKGPKE